MFGPGVNVGAVRVLGHQVQIVLIGSAVDRCFVLVNVELEHLSVDPLHDLFRLQVFERVVDVVGLDEVDETHALLVLERDLLFIDLKRCELVHIRLVHPSLEAADQVAMHVDRVLDVVDSVLQLLLEVLGVLVGKLFLIVADRVEHRAELLELLL